MITLKCKCCDVKETWSKELWEERCKPDSIICANCIKSKTIEEITKILVDKM